MNKKTPTKTIEINNYVRYWDSSEPNGHNIQILKTDGSLLKIKMRWPKGEEHINLIKKLANTFKRLINNNTFRLNRNIQIQRI